MLNRLSVKPIALPTGSRAKPRPPGPRLLAVLALCLAGAGSTHGQGTITFDGPPVQPPGTGTVTTYYYESGMRLLPLPPATGFLRMGGGGDALPENPTAYLQSVAGEALTFDWLRGVPFGLTSVDLAEYSTLFSLSAASFGLQFLWNQLTSPPG